MNCNHNQKLYINCIIAHKTKLKDNQYRKKTVEKFLWASKRGVLNKFRNSSRDCSVRRVADRRALYNAIYAELLIDGFVYTCFFPVRIHFGRSQAKSMHLQMCLYEELILATILSECPSLCCLLRHHISKFEWQFDDHSISFSVCSSVPQICNPDFKTGSLIDFWISGYCGNVFG